MLTHRFEEALILATQLHSKQVRKGTNTPYVAHLLGVVSIALENGADEDEAIAALLHDTVEDQGGAETLEKVRGLFGERVAEIVDGCTDAKVVPKPPWRARKEAYIQHLTLSSPSVRLVSAADKLYNARSILLDYRVLGEELWQRFTGGREGTLWYYRALVEAYKAHGTTPLLDELERTVSEIERISASKPSP